MLDWIFEGIITWVSSVVTDLMDAVSGMFLQALGTDMTAMEEYFPFVSKSFTIIPSIRWAGYRCGKSVDTDWQKRNVRIAYRLFKADILDVS